VRVVRRPDRPPVAHGLACRATWVGSGACCDDSVALLPPSGLAARVAKEPHDSRMVVETGADVRPARASEPWGGAVTGRGMTLPSNTRLAPASTPTDTVGVVITSYNHAHFLDDALQSVCAQTRPVDAVVVVDDGSTDDPAAVVSRFPGVHLIRQENLGLAAARNAGLARLDASYVVFLDADDRLEPGAIDAGLACFARAPESGFVYGGHRYIDENGDEIGQRFEPPGDQPYVQLLRGNFIAMHGTVMYHRERLLAIGGFDETLRRCEDYDVYLRMAKRYPVAGYADLVAAYRLHSGNMSADHRGMLRSALHVHARYEPSARADREAWAAGRRRWRRTYAEMAADARYKRRTHGGALATSLPVLAWIAMVAPSVALRQVVGGLRRRVAALLPRDWGRALLGGREHVPALGQVRFGDLNRLTPISDCFGFDRGLPVDRYYIDRFLARHSSEIVGRVLEIGDATYTEKFGGARVSRSDVLHVHPGNPRATIVGDLTDASVLPENAFDCIVLTQTLHLIFDVPLAVARIHRALAPGGVALVTVPGISQVDRGKWGQTWFWSFTPAAMRRLFGAVFGADAVLVESYGNVFSATAFLQGLALEELQTSDLDAIDEAYPVIVAVRARKRSR
jgi:glycosyltransferase involved in cell wall biosynthesis